MFLQKLRRSEMHNSSGVNYNSCHKSAFINGTGPAIEIAVDLYSSNKVSLWKAAEISGLCMKEFKDLFSCNTWVLTL
jgi:hypothetical protein